MGSISEFITRQLASEAVGTAGARRPTLGAAIAGAGGKIANIGFQELARKKDIVDTIDAATKVREFERQQQEVIKQLETDFRDNPYEGVKIFEGGLTGAIGDFINQEGTSDEVKRKMANQINQIGTRNSRQMNVNAYNQNVVNVTDAINGQISQASASILADPTNDALFAAEVALTLDLVDQSIVLFDAEAGQKFKEAARENLALALTNGLKDKNPILGLDILNRGDINALMAHNPAKLTSEKTAMRNSIKGWRTKVKFNNLASLSRLDDDILTQFLDGTIKTVAQVEEIEASYLEVIEQEGIIDAPPEFKKGFAALKKIVEEQMFADATDKPEINMQLEQDYQRLKFFEGDDVQYQQAILEYKTKLLELAANGDLERDTWESFGRRVIIEEAKGLQLEEGSAGKRWWFNPVAWVKGLDIPPSTPTGFGTELINNFIEGFTFPNKLIKSDAHFKLTKALVKETADMERAGKTVDENIARGIANRLIFDEVEKINPELLDELKGDTIYSGGSWWKVGLNSNGVIDIIPTSKPSPRTVK